MKITFVLLIWMLLVQFDLRGQNRAGSLTCEHGKYECQICAEKYKKKNDENVLPPNSNVKPFLIPNAPAQEFKNGGTIDFSTPAQQAAAAEKARKQAEKMAGYQKLNNDLMNSANASRENQRKALENVQERIRDAGGQISEQHRPVDPTGAMGRALQNEISTDDLILQEELESDPGNDLLNGIIDNILDSDLPNISDGTRAAVDFLGNKEDFAEFTLDKAKNWADRALDENYVFDDQEAEQDWREINWKTADIIVGEIPVIRDIYGGAKGVAQTGVFLAGQVIEAGRGVKEIIDASGNLVDAAKSRLVYEAKNWWFN